MSLSISEYRNSGKDLQNKIKRIDGGISTEDYLKKYSSKIHLLQQALESNDKDKAIHNIVEFFMIAKQPIPSEIQDAIERDDWSKLLLAFLVGLIGE